MKERELRERVKELEVCALRLEAARSVFKQCENWSYDKTPAREKSAIILPTHLWLRLGQALTESGGGESRDGGDGIKLDRIGIDGHPIRPAALECQECHGSRMVGDTGHASPYMKDWGGHYCPSCAGTDRPPSQAPEGCDTNAGQTSLGESRRSAPGETRVGLLLVRGGVPMHWYTTENDLGEEVSYSKPLTDSPADLPYKLAREASQEQHKYMSRSPHGTPDGLYDVWRVGDCERCVDGSWTNSRDSKIKCATCNGDGGRYELRAKEVER